MALFKCIVSDNTQTWMEVVSARNAKKASQILSSQTQLTHVTKPVRIDRDVARSVAINYLKNQPIFLQGIANLLPIQSKFRNASSFSVSSVLGNTNYISIASDNKHTLLVVEDDIRRLNEVKVHHMNLASLEDVITSEIIPHLN